MNNNKQSQYNHSTRAGHQKINQKNKVSKENLLAGVAKPNICFSSVKKGETDLCNNDFFFSKNNSGSNVCKGREVIKKLAAIESVPSRFSAGSNAKRQSLSLERERRVLESIERKREQING